MDATVAIGIRARAADLLDEAYANRNVLWPRQPDISWREFLRQAPEKIATDILGLELIQGEDIFSDPQVLASKKPVVKTVGQFDGKQIFAAQEYGPARTRFTIAHEIGHAIFHPGTVCHRETAFGKMAIPILTSDERDVNLFAAELLMPADLVRAEFLARFKSSVSGTEGHEALLYWLSREGAKIDEGRFTNDRRYRAIQFAISRCFHEPFELSLQQWFIVNPEPMAIQLENLGWIE